MIYAHEPVAARNLYDGIIPPIQIKEKKKLFYLECRCINVTRIVVY